MGAYPVPPRAASVVLDNGEELPCGLVVAGVGVVPSTGFIRGAEKSGLDLDKDGGIRLATLCAAVPTSLCMIHIVNAPPA